jgi:hypothetical protein
LTDLDAPEFLAHLPASPPSSAFCGLGPWHPVLVHSVYEAAGGEEGILRLAQAWHARVLADEEVSHAFSHGYHPEHTERLAAY